MKYAGIGSRETPTLVLDAMFDIAYKLGSSGWTLRSGGAQGADSAFERGHYSAVSNNAEIYLPWRGFNNNFSPLHEICDQAMDIAESYHPAWDRLSQGAQKLMARNSYQVLGKQLNDPVDFIICYTPRGKGGGGTGQALRIAKDFNIPVWDYGLSMEQNIPIIEAQQNLEHYIKNHF